LMHDANVVKNPDVHRILGKPDVGKTDD
jgi:hypothetical protein